MSFRLRPRAGLLALGLASLALALALGSAPPAAPGPAPAEGTDPGLERSRAQIGLAMPYFSFGKRSREARS
ncbi:hypothetical protein [Silanimonas lenta]|uniref:hypothetical protein n=1 Tax=Silanimonas lenta TaxID=265429 RepID=UPI00041716E0|nr:hypothetical protein [Silanimonas lenta]